MTFTDKEWLLIGMCLFAGIVIGILICHYVLPNEMIFVSNGSYNVTMDVGENMMKLANMTMK